MPYYNLLCSTCGELHNVLMRYSEMQKLVETGVCSTCGKPGLVLQMSGAPNIIIRDDSRRDRAKANLNKIAKDDIRREGGH